MLLYKGARNVGYFLYFVYTSLPLALLNADEAWDVDDQEQ